MQLADRITKVETALRAHFAGAEYAVTNRQSGSDFLREMSSGVYLLLGYIFAALFLLILLILYVRLCDYIEGSRPLIRSLYRLGASKRTPASKRANSGRIERPELAIGPSPRHVVSHGSNTCSTSWRATGLPSALTPRR